MQKVSEVAVESGRGSNNLFKKGMTLNEYMDEMENEKVEEEDNSGEKTEEDLYETSRVMQPTNSKKLITYEIR